MRGKYNERKKEELKRNFEKKPWYKLSIKIWIPNNTERKMKINNIKFILHEPYYNKTSEMPFIFLFKIWKCIQITNNNSIEICKEQKFSDFSFFVIVPQNFWFKLDYSYSIFKSHLKLNTLKIMRDTSNLAHMVCHIL